MKPFIGTLSATAVLAAALAGTTGNAVATPDRTKVGSLNCDISAGIGVIIASRKHLTCMFTPSQPGPREVYVGTISKFGLDIGATTGGELVWAVYAPTDRRYGALAGNYGGASAEASLGIGAGANVLVGGSEGTVALQPISVQGQTGVNLAAGVTGIELRPAR